MKTTALIARILLGFVFLVFGLNGFLHFIPMPPREGVADQFLGALFVSHFRCGLPAPAHSRDPASR
jgi:putative oxidoreductase